MHLPYTAIAYTWYNVHHFPFGLVTQWNKQHAVSLCFSMILNHMMSYLLDLTNRLPVMLSEHILIFKYESNMKSKHNQLSKYFSIFFLHSQPTSNTRNMKWFTHVKGKMECKTLIVSCFNASLVKGPKVRSNLHGMTQKNVNNIRYHFIEAEIVRCYIIIKLIQ